MLHQSRPARTQARKSVARLRAFTATNSSKVPPATKPRSFLGSSRRSYAPILRLNFGPTLGAWCSASICGPWMPPFSWVPLTTAAACSRAVLSTHKQFRHGGVCADDGNEDSCGACRGIGVLICCENCPAAFHATCAGYSEPHASHCEIALRAGSACPASSLYRSKMRPFSVVQGQSELSMRKHVFIRSVHGIPEHGNFH